jgi:hypothetical protein
MWIAKPTYDMLVQERMQLQANLTAAQALVASQKSTLEWLMLRMTQLEAERAKLLWKYMGVSVPVPEISHEPEPGSSFDNPMNALPSFGDMGEDKAAKDGYGWNEAGELTLHGVRI